MKFDFASILSEPKYAAIAGAIVGLIVKYIENKMSKADETKSTVLGYIKCAGYSAALSALIVYLINRSNYTFPSASSSSSSTSSSMYRRASYPRGGGGGGSGMYGGGSLEPSSRMYGGHTATSGSRFDYGSPY